MNLHSWLRVCFFNLLLVATLGILLRYKIAFSLPFIDQKHVLHSHSHFAFTGWITQTIMVLFVHYLHKRQQVNAFDRYKYFLILNLLCGYGMMISFIIQGYALFSISFSTLTIFLSYAFAYRYWKDLNRVSNENSVHHWFKAAMVFNILSSLGAFTLAILMATRLANQKLYLSSVYYFLHFQYNGWFFFACMGLFFYLVKLNSYRLQQRIFWLFALACVPAYFLSILWATMHSAVYWLVVLAAIIQAVGWGLFCYLLIKNFTAIKEMFAAESRFLVLLSLIACTLKITLQLFSVIPTLSTLAFSFRPIVIGYLHLVLLGVISLFLLGYIVANQFFVSRRMFFIGISIFVGGILLNELFLMLQGVCAIGGLALPYINEALFGVALTLFTGILLLNVSAKKSDRPAERVRL